MLATVWQDWLIELNGQRIHNLLPLFIKWKWCVNWWKTKKKLKLLLLCWISAWPWSRLTHNRVASLGVFFTSNWVMWVGSFWFLFFFSNSKHLKRLIWNKMQKYTFSSNPVPAVSTVTSPTWVSLTVIGPLANALTISTGCMSFLEHLSVGCSAAVFTLQTDS